MPLLVEAGRTLHIRVDGRSYDVSFEQLGLVAESSDAQVKQQVSRFLEIAVNRLTDTVIDRHANGNWTIRPEAVFG